MVGTPVWQAPTAGQAPRAAHVNQLLGLHTTTTLYSSTAQASQTTNGVTSTSTNGLYLAESFITGASQTLVGYVVIPLSTTTTSGTSLVPTTVSIYSNSAGAPGTALVSTTVTAEYANLATAGTATNRLTVPVPATVTAATTYWIVVTAAGNVSNSYTWYRSNQVTGASTSPDGVTWTGQAYGFVYQVFDQTPAAQTIKCTYEDSGARWTASTFTAQNMTSTFAEYTVGQTTSGYLQSFRTYTYSNGILTGVA